MTSEELAQLDSPDSLGTPLLKAMWLAAKDDWEGAHNIAQDIDTSMGSRVHGYLHWVEGDIWNADYWYRRSGITRPNVSLNEEWHSITTLLLKA